MVLGLLVCHQRLELQRLLLVHRVPWVRVRQHLLVELRIGIGLVVSGSIRELVELELRGLQARLAYHQHRHDRHDQVGLRDLLVHDGKYSTVGMRIELRQEPLEEQQRWSLLAWHRP